MELTKPRSYSLIETAVLVRQELKAMFPGIKFSVRTDRSCSSIDVSWTDGPFVKDVDKVVGRFAMGDFDGRDDSYRTRPPTLMAYEDGSYGDERYGARYVNTRRTLSATYKAQLAIVAAEIVTTQSSYSWDMDASYPVGFYYEGYGTIPSHGNGHELCWRLSQAIAPQA